MKEQSQSNAMTKLNLHSPQKKAKSRQQLFSYKRKAFSKHSIKNSVFTSVNILKEYTLRANGNASSSNNNGLRFQD